MVKLMKNFGKKFSTLLVAGLVVLGSASTSDAAGKYAVFTGKSGTTLKTSVSNVKLYSNAVLKAGPEGIPVHYLYGTVGGKRAFESGNWKYSNGYFIVLEERTETIYMKGSGYQKTTMCKIQRVEKIGTLNGEPVFGIDKSSTSRPNGIYEYVYRYQLSHVSGYEYVVGKDDEISRRWTSNATLRNFFKNNNVTKVKQTLL